jgi:3-oxoacyl-(acyl-carrier-protein) synthase
MTERSARVIAQGVVAPGVRNLRDLRLLSEGQIVPALSRISEFTTEGYACDLAFHADAELAHPERARRVTAGLVDQLQDKFGVSFDVDVDLVDSAARFLFACCDQLEDDIGPLPAVMGDRAGIFLGTCSAHAPTATTVNAVKDEDYRSLQLLQCLPISGTLLKMYLGWDEAAAVSVHLTTTGCSASIDAIGRAAAAIRSGRLDFAVAGGVDIVNEPLFRGFDLAHSLTNAPCRPFDVGHQGFQLGEGAGLVALSAFPGDVDTGTVEALGSGLDGYSLMLPDPAGVGLQTAVSRALSRAGGPAGGVIGHGVATPSTDDMELRAYSAQLPEGTPVMSLKSTFGHSLGAAGVHNILVGLQALSLGALPGTLNLEKPLDTPLSLSPGSIPLRAPRVLVAAPAFGGHNLALVLARENL